MYIHQEQYMSAYIYTLCFCSLYIIQLKPYESIKNVTQGRYQISRTLFIFANEKKSQNYTLRQWEKRILHSTQSQSAKNEFPIELGQMFIKYRENVSTEQLTSNNNQENILFIFYLKWESVFHYYTIVPSLYRNQNGYISLETYWFMVILPKGFSFKKNEFILNEEGI